MKKIAVIIFVFQAILISIQAQTFADEKAELLQVNNELISNFKAKNWDNALKLGQRAIELNRKIYGEETIETATAYKNLGIIYRTTKKYDEAIANLQKALIIYRLKADENVEIIARTLADLGVTFLLSGDVWQARKHYIEALANAEKAFGNEAKEIIPFIVTMREIYIVANNVNEAQKLFVRQYLIVRKYSQEDSEELKEVRDAFTCFIYQSYGAMGSDIKQDEFDEAIKPKQEGAAKIDEDSIPRGEVINGKAKKLVKPDYPLKARQKRAQGLVLVRVTINEEGKVEKAVAFCGDEELRKVSEKAAQDSKFAPTTLDGKGVKVIGIIIYNFVP